VDEAKQPTTKTPDSRPTILGWIRKQLSDNWGKIASFLATFLFGVLFARSLEFVPTYTLTATVAGGKKVIVTPGAQIAANAPPAPLVLQVTLLCAARVKEQCSEWVQELWFPSVEEKPTFMFSAGVDTKPLGADVNRGVFKLGIMRPLQSGERIFVTTLVPSRVIWEHLDIRDNAQQSRIKDRFGCEERPPQDAAINYLTECKEKIDWVQAVAHVLKM
jgi:hypothetical protein